MALGSTIGIMTGRRAVMRGALVIGLCVVACAFVACTSDAPAPVVLKGLTPDSSTAAGTPATGSVTVGSGDTVYAIARRNGVSVRNIIALNELSPPYLLRVGQVLKLPEARFHTVAAGDTLYGISRRYRIDVYRLAKLNGLKRPYTIKVGQRLRLNAARAGGDDRAQSRTLELVATPRGAFSWPVEGRILSSFGPKTGGIHNDGIDIAVTPGAAVRAAGPGVVAYAGNGLRGLGHLLLIRHEGGWITAYANNEEILVQRGDIVRQGQTIARGGATDNVALPKLHFEIRNGTEAVDPLRYLPDSQA